MKRSLLTNVIIQLDNRLTRLNSIFFGIICSTQVTVNKGYDDVAVIDHLAISFGNCRFVVHTCNSIGNNDIIVGIFIILFVGIKFAREIRFD